MVFIQNKVLVSVAEAILMQLKGQGYWVNFKDEAWVKIDNPLVGLEVGHIVYSYDLEKIGFIKEDFVCCVYDGIAYTAHKYDKGPELIPIDCDNFSKSKREALEASRKQIENDFDYHNKHLKALVELKVMLESKVS